MRISRDTVRHLARLSHLELSDADEVHLTESIEALLAFTECLDQADLSGIDSADALGERVSALREDVARVRPEEPDPTLAAPGSRDRLFRVPPAIPGA